MACRRMRSSGSSWRIEQSIGRGLRLPYGARTGVTAVDRLNIVAHDRFQEIIDEAKRPGSAIQLQSVVLDPAELGQRTATVVSQTRLATQLGIQPAAPTDSTRIAGADEPTVFDKPEEQALAQLAYAAIQQLGAEPHRVPTVAHLLSPEVQAAIVQAVEENRTPAQTELELDGPLPAPDIAAVVAKTVDLVARQTIDIPRILVVPTGEVRSGFNPFTLDLSALRYPAVSDELWVQHLRTGTREVIALGHGDVDEARLEGYVVSGLTDFDDISYDDHAQRLYDLAGQTVAHFRTYLSADETRKVLRCYQQPIAAFIHAQMQRHWFEEAAGYEVKVSRGFTELKASAYTCAMHESPANYRVAPADKTTMARTLFGDFQRCLYPVQKFDSDAERRLAVILERESLRWFRPARGQFQMVYRDGAEHRETSRTSWPRWMRVSICWSRRCARNSMTRSSRPSRQWPCVGASTPRPMPWPTAASPGATC
jgi:type III restriction enzyme